VSQKNYYTCVCVCLRRHAAVAPVESLSILAVVPDSIEEHVKNSAISAVLQHFTDSGKLISNS
jgi:hypothetical protein